MQKNNHIKKKIKASNSGFKNFGYYIPIIFIIIIVPLITYGKIIELPIEEANFWGGGTTQLDFFCYYKSLVFVLATIASFLAYGGLFLNNKLPIQKEKKYYVPMLVYTLFTIISTLMSSNKNVSLFGFIEMYQGMFVLICYMLMLFILINYISSDRDIKIIIYSFAAVTAVEGILGLGQFLGYDFLKSSIGQFLITPKELRGIDLRFAFGKYTIYGTLYNTNFVGSFGTLVLPVTLSLYLFSNDKKKTIIYGFSAILAFITWLGSNSRAGYLGILVSLIIGVVIFRRIIKGKYKETIIILSIFLCIFISFNAVAEGRTLSQFFRLNPATEAKNIVSVNQEQPIKFEEVSIKDNTFTIKTNNETLNGSMEEEKLCFRNENGEKLGAKINSEGKITFVDEKYAGYSFLIQSDKPSQVKANIYGRNWDLFITPEQNIKVISINNKLTEPIAAPHVEFLDGRETFASNRGYVWSRTIPMLKDTILIGYGPDNYPMVFPQEDYIGRFNVGTTGMMDIVIDKPHNMYLQTAVNTGVISLLALIFIWAVYLIDCLKIYINGNMKSFAEYMGAAIFLSITAYLVAGIFNDNVISVTPLFWVLLGTGIGINRMVKESLVKL